MCGAAAFGVLFRDGRRVTGVHLQLLFAPAAEPVGRIGFIAGRSALPRAVDRNRLRRVLREAVRLRRPAINAFDIILRLRGPCPRVRLHELAAEAATLLDRVEMDMPR